MTQKDHESSVLAIVTILLCAGFLFAGNGLFQTLLPIRAGQEGYSAAMIGVMGTAYFGGFTIGCFVGPKLIAVVGHVRVFAGLMALLTATFLAFPLYIDPWFWGGLRVVSGISIAVIYIVTESWLNDASSNANRGRVLSAYIIVTNIVTMIGQLLVTTSDTADSTLFLVVAILICLAIVPISLTPAPAPAQIPSARLNLRKLYAISPVGIFGCVATGAAEGAFWSLGPVFAQEREMITSDIALLMAAFVLGGTLSQWPLGWISDKIDRRIVIGTVSCGTVLSGLAIGFDATGPGVGTLALAVAHGALMIPIYALCISHANDSVSNEQMVETSGGLILAYSIGATIGPAAASQIMKGADEAGLFLFIGLVLFLLGVFAIYRLAVDTRKRVKAKVHFAATSAASPTVFPPEDQL